MPERDYYEVLNLPRDATADQIKQAYRKLAKQYHPDRNHEKGAEARFKEVQTAYDVLADAEKRKAYDQFGHAGTGRGHTEQAWRGAPSGGERVYSWRPGASDIPVEDLEDLFSTFGGAGRGDAGSSVFDQFFGRGARGRGTARPGRAEPEPGRDVEQGISLPFEQAILGTTLDVTMPDGSQMRVKIPPGVADGQRIRIRGKGLPSRQGGPPGDLYIVPRIQPHPYFRRIDNDIYLDLPITISEATLGSRIEVPTLNGRSVLTIPPGAASGARLRLKGKGVKINNKPAGDQYAVIKIVPPKTFTDHQRSLLEEFRTQGEGSPRANLGW